MRWGVALVLLLTFASEARAQEDVCVEGRVATDDTDGRCCWPGQRWSNELSRCEGVPQCPEGRLMSGEDCIEDESGTGTPPPPPDATAAGQEGTDAATATGAGAPDSFVEPSTPAGPATEQRTQKNVPFIIAGAASFGLGYLWSALMAVAAYQETGVCPDRPYFFFIPVAGGVMGAVNGAECGASGAYWLSLGAVAAQAAGIVLFALGFIDRPVEEDGSVALSEDLALVSGGADVGLGLRLSL